MRLARATLAHLPPGIARPAYDPAAHGVGIVHLGIGAFHRAHQAVYTDAAMSADGGDWRITGVSLRSPAVRDQLTPQDGLFTLVERARSGDRLRVIGAVADVLVAPKAPARVLAALAAPTTHVVSLTVTEKGYGRDPATGRLDRADAGVAHDIADRRSPVTAPGYLVAALARRRAAGVAAPTIVSCDNLPDNGATLKRVLVELAGIGDPALADWIEGEVACPSTMVDRIVPATTPDDIAALSATIGVVDQAMVKAEPFSQWVIEDRFSGPRPAWEAGGARFVADVRPFELAKLRLLNGAHSALAYLGLLAGHEFVHEAVADPAVGGVVAAMMAEEIAPTLAPAAGLDLLAYRAALLDRFANPAMAHRLAQIAIDGSQKLPQRLLGTVRDRLAAGASIDRLARALAAWMRFAATAPTLDDPLANRLRAAARDPGDAVAAFLAIAPVFGDLAGCERLHAAIAARYAETTRLGGGAIPSP